MAIAWPPFQGTCSTETNHVGQGKGKYDAWDGGKRGGKRGGYSGYGGSWDPYSWEAQVF